MRGEQVGRVPGWLRVTLASAGEIILFAALSLLIWTVLPTIALGATPVVISGGSMAPLIRAGDVVLLDDATPPPGEMFAPGTVITFDATDASGSPTGGLVTHRVTDLSDGEYITRGDANRTDDVRSVHPDQLIGSGRWLVPVVGLPAHWARSGAWHLVVLTVLVGAAAVAASLAGRRRVIVEESEELEDDRIVEQPLEPILPEPVLAFQLDLETPAAGADPADEPARDDEDVLEPAAAERAATIAARAARRGLAGLDRVREQERDDRRTARRRRRTGGTGGSAPIASILVFAVALVAATMAPSFTAAAFVASTDNTGNSFAVAEAASVDVDVAISEDWGAGYCANVTVSTAATTPIAWQVELDLGAPPLLGTPYDVWNATWSFGAPILTASGAGNGWNDTVVAGKPATWGFCANRPVPTTLVLPAHNGQTTLLPPQNTAATYAWQFPTSQPTTINGPVTATLRLRSSTPPHGPSQRYVQVELLVNGTPIAASEQVEVVHDVDWHTQTVTLAPTVTRTIPAGSTIEVRVRSYRYDLQVTGSSFITLPTTG